MIKKWKRILKPVWVSLCILMLPGSAVVLSGCGQERAPQNTVGESGAGADPGQAVTILDQDEEKSRQKEDGAEEEKHLADMEGNVAYRETSVALPEGTGEVYALREVQDQVLMVTDQGMYVSADQGGTWSRNEDFPGTEYTKAAIGPSGEAAWCGNTEVITVWSPDGALKELHLDFPEDGVCYTMEFLSGDKLMAMDTSSNIQVLDITEDKVTGELPADGGYYLLAGAAGGRILVWNMDGTVQLFDASGGNPELCEPAEQIFKQTDVSGLGVGNYGVVTPDSDNEGFFYAGRRGLFHYTLGGSVAEQLIEGEQTAMGDNNYLVTRLAPLADGSFLAVYMDCNSMAFSMKRYDVRSARELENQVELSLYTLYDSELLRQEVNILMQENPDYMISVEVGVTGENGVTAGDAIKTLNTELMAGEGPDILLLDGIEIEPYIEKGILADLSDAVAQADEEEGLLRNITDAYAEAESICAVPTRFLMPLVMGAPEDIAGITDLVSLKERTELLKSEYPEKTSILGMYGKTYLETLFDLCAPAWISRDGVDQEGLEEFLEMAKQIQKIQQEGVSAEDISEVTGISDYYNRDCGDSELMWMCEVKYHDQKLGLFYSASINGSMAMLTSGQSFDYASGQCSHVFVPKEIIGVNASGDHVEEAKSLVHDFLLSASQTQFVLSDMGHPVNRTALEALVDKELHAEGRLESWLEGSDATAEDVRLGYEKLIGMAAELDTCAVNDDIVREIVLEHGMSYLDGQEDLDQAANAIAQGLGLRMTE